MLYAKYLAAGSSFTFEQEDMGKFRKSIYDKIKTAKLKDIIWDGEEEFELPEQFTESEKETASEQFIHATNKHGNTGPSNTDGGKEHSSSQFNIGEKLSLNKKNTEKERLAIQAHSQIKKQFQLMKATK